MLSSGWIDETDRRRVRISADNNPACENGCDPLAPQCCHHGRHGAAFRSPRHCDVGIRDHQPLPVRSLALVGDGEHLGRRNGAASADPDQPLWSLCLWDSLDSVGGAGVDRRILLRGNGWKSRGQCAGNWGNIGGCTRGLLSEYFRLGIGRNRHPDDDLSWDHRPVQHPRTRPPLSSCGTFRLARIRLACTASPLRAGTPIRRALGAFSCGNRGSAGVARMARNLRMGAGPARRCWFHPCCDVGRRAMRRHSCSRLYTV